MNKISAVPALLLPDRRYQEPYLEMAAEACAEGWWYGKAPALIGANFEQYLEELENARFGRNIPEGWVPWTEFWILDSGALAGYVTLRHALSPRLERLGGHAGYYIRKAYRKRNLGHFALQSVLPVAKKLRLTRMLLTCNDDNLASIRIIEKAGGVLQDKIQNEGKSVQTRRYWIELA